MWFKFFINYLIRVIYKRNTNVKKNIFFSNLAFKNFTFTFSRKFFRKTTINVRSKIKSWIEKNIQLEKKLWAFYKNPKTKNAIFNIKNINKLKKLLIGYNYVQSLQVIKVLPAFKNRIVQKILPYDVKSLQCIFIKSFCIVILAVFEFSKLIKSKIIKINNIQQQFIKVNSYKHQKLRIVKKNLQNKIVKQLNLKFLKKMLKFRYILLRQCNLKKIRKNYKEDNIRCILVSKINKNIYQPLDISTLKDKILQQVITWGILPINEYQTDSLSFGFRPNRSVKQAITFIFRKLSKNKISKKKTQFSFIMIKKKHFDKFIGKKARFKISKIVRIKSKKKKQFKYFYNYWIYPTKNYKLVPLKFCSQYYYLNANIAKCFNQLNYQIIYSKIFLANNYMFFIKCWSANIIINSKFKENNTFKLLPERLQTSIISFLIYSTAFDGLQDFIQKKLFNTYIKFQKKLKYLKIKPILLQNNFQVFCIRHVNNILILSKCFKKHKKKIQYLLMIFLNRRGFNANSLLFFQNKLFKSGSSFEYLCGVTTFLHLYYFAGYITVVICPSK